MNLTDLRALICKNCGAPLDITKAQSGVIKCAYCSRSFTLPKDTAEQKVLDFLSQGEHDLDTGKFDDAYSAFSKACELDKTEPEAYWGMALAEFKIQYLKDEVNNRLQPICHEISDKDFADSANFLKAIRYATEAQKSEYERKADEINYIKNEFYKIAKTGIKYDCFICVKVSDENGGGRTQDYKAADDIYFELKGKGYKPFFSERELVDVTGADYEARILYALKSSECMLVVCFDEAYLRTKWVKNEYLRFLKLVNDEEKESDSIALVFGDRPIEKLPGKKGKIQGIAFNSLTAIERIVSFVDSHTPEARKRREETLRKKEEEAKRKAQEDEAQRKKFAEQEEQLRQQAELIRKLQEQMQNQPQAQPTGGLSDEELFERMERARQERERKQREREEAERKAREERERIEREKREAEERARIQAERERQEKERIERDFEIWNGVLIKYYGTVTEVVIPNGVTSIGDKAFTDCTSLKSITIPDGVTSIRDDAFYYCINLTSITIPDGVTSIGNSAFEGCRSLTSITIPDGVTNINRGAFWGCSKLSNITIPNSVKSIGYSAFWGCNSLTSVTIPDSVTSIGERAFLGNSLTSVTIPDSVTSIGERAFSSCSSLTSITIPESVTSIGKELFYNCSELKKIYCRVKSKPKTWDKDWDKKEDKKYGGRHKVVWGYKGD